MGAGAGGIPGLCQPHGSDRRAIRLNPKECAAVEIARLTDPSESLPHRIIDPVGGKVDEACRQSGDEPLELELSLDRQAVRVFDVPARREVDHDSEHKGTVLGGHGTQSNLDRKLRAVSASAEQIAAGTHRARPRHRHEALAVGRVRSTMGRRQEHVDGLGDQLVARVTELQLDLLVRQHDEAGGIHEENTAWQ